MICTTIINKDGREVIDALESCEMAEIRLDRCNLTMREIEECFSSDVPTVATCRIADLMANEPSLQDESLSVQSREIKAMQIAEKRLCKAIKAGARYVDVEIEAPKVMSKRVRNVAHENGAVFIRSFHDYTGTPSDDNLRAAIVKCHYHGADIVKIVTAASAQEDVSRVMALYEWCSGLGSDLSSLADGGLIAFCMGEAGKSSRVECLRRGAPFTYAALEAGAQAAPGQLTMEEMKREVYGDYRFTGVGGEGGNPLSMPVSKSFAQRAIIAAALAEGTSHLRGYASCGDNDSALAVAESLGAQVSLNGDVLTITGIAASAGMYGAKTLDVGESGLLARMMIPLMSQLCRGEVAFTGRDTLIDRPLAGAKDILDVFGVRTASPDPLMVPLTVEGPLRSGRMDISGRHGSQLISGLLMALPFSERNTTLTVHDPKSIPYMFITLEVLKKFGIKTGNEMLGGRDFLESDGDWSLCSEIVFKVKGGQRYKAADMDLEADWSAAANFLVAGAVFGKAELSGMDTTSLQADLSIMDVLMDAGASLSQTDGEKGDIIVQRAPLRAFCVDASNCPDLFPVISVLAAFCQGTSRIAGVERLSGKESDRAAAILEMLEKLGVQAHVSGDELLIRGHSLAERLVRRGSDGPGLLKGGSFSSHRDHRMVMALKVASLGADSPVIIDDVECVRKSFPQFCEIFERYRTH